MTKKSEKLGFNITPDDITESMKTYKMQHASLYPSPDNTIHLYRSIADLGWNAPSQTDHERTSSFSVVWILVSDEWSRKKKKKKKNRHSIQHPMTWMYLSAEPPAPNLPSFIPVQGCRRRRARARAHPLRHCGSPHHLTFFSLPAVSLRKHRCIGEPPEWGFTSACRRRLEGRCEFLCERVGAAPLPRCWCCEKGRWGCEIRGLRGGSAVGFPSRSIQFGTVSSRCAARGWLVPAKRSRSGGARLSQWWWPGNSLVLVKDLPMSFMK